MKKLAIALSGIFLGFFLSFNAIADVAFDNTPGAELDLDVATPGAPNFTFAPSTNVNLRGTSSATSYSSAAYHQLADGKTAGQAYGMAADSNKMFWLSIETSGNAPASGDLSGTTSAVFSSWYTM